MTDEQLLALIELELQARLNAGTPEEYETATDFRYRATPLSVLLKERTDLKRKIAIANGGGLHLIKEACL